MQNMKGYTWYLRNKPIDISLDRLVNWLVKMSYKLCYEDQLRPEITSCDALIIAQQSKRNQC